MNLENPSSEKIFASPVAKILKNRPLVEGKFIRTVGYLENLKRALQSKLAQSKTTRSQSLVSEKYRSIYSPLNSQWAESRQKRKDIFIEGNQCIETDGWYLMSAYHQAINQWVHPAEIRTILEVGSGRGQNLVTLSLRHPEKSFTGLEYSPEGVMRARELAESPLQELVAISKKPLTTFQTDFVKIDLSKNSQITSPASTVPSLQFVQGSAFQTPFENKSFDLSYTCLVLEQMPMQFKEAVNEMRRVTKKYCLFLEPFREANDFMGMQHLKNVDYFRYSIKEIENLGFEIVAFNTLLPQKLRFSAGLLIAKPKP